MFCEYCSPVQICGGKIDSDVWLIRSELYCGIGAGFLRMRQDISTANFWHAYPPGSNSGHPFCVQLYFADAHDQKVRRNDSHFTHASVSSTPNLAGPSED